ncbi:hypothetical protein POP12_121 [Pectobacterium phage POP12]|nr:hypothetical protein POP12_121 [Pectobacterium phage POP12]
MAYVNKETKAKIVAAVKAVLPKDWKATFAVRNYSEIVCTIRKAPFELADVFDGVREGHYNVNQYHIKAHCKDEKIAEALQKIVDALNLDNYDNSDPMTDYFDVGHYITLQFGSWDKPFENY